MDIPIASEYHSCDGQAGVAKIIIGTLFEDVPQNFGIMQNGEKHKDFCGTNFVGRHLLLGLMDLVSTKSKPWSDEIVLIWWEANRSFSRVPLCWQILWDNWRASFHSDESELFLGSQSAVTFSSLERHSTVTVILHWRRWSQKTLKLSCCPSGDKWLCVQGFWEGLYSQLYG